MASSVDGPPGLDVPVVDVHAHHFPAAARMDRVVPADPRWPTLVVDDDTTGRVLVAGSTFRVVDSRVWDVSARIAAMNATGTAVQVVSPTPVLLTYWADVEDAVPFCRLVNDLLAEDVATARGRMVGLGGVPLQDVDAAVHELRRAVRDLGFAGVEIGTNAGSRELDDPALDPFWSAAEELDAVVYIHPREGGGEAIRRRGQPYDFGLGMLTDTAMAAVALLNGGVLDRHPGLRVCLAHGCGTFPWAFPRLRIGGRMTSDPAIVDRYEELSHRLWADTLVFDPRHLDLLVARFGADHLLFGSDFPFIPGVSEGARAFVGAAVSSGALTVDQAVGVLAGNAATFLGSGRLDPVGPDGAAARRA